MTADPSAALAAIRVRVAADRHRGRDLAPHGVIVWTGTPRPRDAVKVIERRKDDDSGWWMTDGSGLADYVWDGGGTWTTAYALLAEVQRRDDALAADARCFRDDADLREYRVRQREHGARVAAAARQARDELVADLRALCDRYERADERFNPPTGQQVAAKVSNLIDRHSPEGE